MGSVQTRDNWDVHWNDYSDAVKSNPAQKYRHKLMVELISELFQGSELSLLDLGSGQGDFMRLAAGVWPKAKLLGFEMSETGVTISRTKVPSAKFLVVDIFRPQGDLDGYKTWANCATCSEVLEHVDDPVGFVREASVYLQEGAKLIVTVPGGPMSEFDRHIGHRTHFTRESIARVLTEGGLNVEATYLSGFPFFNVYRSLIIARGRALINDVRGGEPGVGSPVNIAMKLFDTFFRFNYRNTTMGWQVLAVASKPLCAKN